MIKDSHYFFFLVLAIPLLGAILACRINFDEKELQTTTLEQYYLFDPVSVINGFDHEDQIEFILVDAEPEFPPPSQQISVTWNQVDYLNIVEAVFLHVWKEPLEGWQLKTMDFGLSCAKSNIGLQYGSFIYFKNTITLEGESRTVRYIDIDPRSKSLHIRESEFYPRLVDWGSIGLKEVQFSADQALTLAENNGGREKRFLVDNRCDILLLLSPDLPRYKGWEVRYAIQGDTRFFYVQVDSQTGEIRFP